MNFKHMFTNRQTGCNKNQHTQVSPQLSPSYVSLNGAGTGNPLPAGLHPFLDGMPTPGLLLIA